MHHLSTLSSEREEDYYVTLLLDLQAARSHISVVPARSRAFYGPYAQIHFLGSSLCPLDIINTRRQHAPHIISHASRPKGTKRKRGRIKVPLGKSAKFLLLLLLETNFFSFTRHFVGRNQCRSPPHIPFNASFGGLIFLLPSLICESRKHARYTLLLLWCNYSPRFLRCSFLPSAKAHLWFTLPHSS